MAATHSGSGYYVLDNSGDIFPFGDARSLGSMAGFRLNAPIIALAPTPSGRGYWLLASDGGVFSFGDARFYGSLGGTRLNAPVISMAATRTGRGYWLLASDGGVFSFGDAQFHGSTGNMRLKSPVISMATAQTGRGYWFVAGDGGIFSFGVQFYGSIPGMGLCQSVPGVQIRPTLLGNGYFVLARDGRVFAFGDALAGASAPRLGAWNFAANNGFLTWSTVYSDGLSYMTASHRGKGGVPEGGNFLFEDGRVQWYKFDVRNARGTVDVGSTTGGWTLFYRPYNISTNL